MARRRDLFAAIVLSGMAITGCGRSDPSRDGGARVDSGRAIDAGALADASRPADASGSGDAGLDDVVDASLEDAGEDAMVLIL